ncbi:hypothetical protein G9A89_002543 [Geosiphon pyriformis]|nr:hypothetical protein G9A89_002543 [Geosiphon pyriformis]
MFSFGLDSGYVGAGIVIFINKFLTRHVYKVSEVLSYLLCIRLLFKNKLSISILGLYAGAFLATQFSQADKINFLIVRAINESSFVILGSNFNKDGSYNNSQNVAKTIDYVFVFSNLVNVIMQCNVFIVSEHFDMDYKAVSVSLGLGGLLDANKDQWKFNFKSADEIKWNNFKSSTLANATMFSDEFTASCVVCKVITLLVNEIFKKKWFRRFNKVFTKDSSKFHKLKLLVSRIVKALRKENAENFVYFMKYWSSVDDVKFSVVQNLVDSGAGSNCVHFALFGAKKSYHAFKLTKSLRAKEANIRSAINRRMESFEINKGHMIRSVLECPFHKVMLDHLVVNNNLVLESDLVKSKVDCHVADDISIDWHHQYQSLEYVFDKAFSGVICPIGFDKFFEVVSELPNDKAAGLSDISNKLWKHCDKSVLDMLLVILNFCLSGELAWVLIIPKPYEWKGVLTNTCPIALIKMACKILSDRIFLICSAFDVLYGETVLVYTYEKYHTRRIINSQAEQAIEETTDKLTQLKNLQIIIVTNHFVHQHQQKQTKRLNSNHYPAKSAFNFYVNDKITECLEETVNIEAARENFYTELFQHTNLPRNYSFTLIIREINQTIERYTQQQFFITYADKGKERLQILAKQRIEFPPYLSYHHTLGSTINISSAGMSTPNATSTFGQFIFQNFGISDPWEVMESEKEEEEETEDQKFTYQNLITENPEFETPNLQNQQNLNLVNSEVETLNIQTPPTQDNQNPNLINQPNLPPPPQPPNLDPMAYAPITKLDNFTSKEDDTQVWLNDVKKAIIVNGWNDTQAILINKPQDFNVFKVEFLRYFSNNNSINRLVNIFTTMKQGETEAITTYLGCFHRNLHQIQAINVNYFTAPQILNQFIHGLHNSILQHVCLLHPGTLQDAVTHARDFELVESETNHAQAINLVMNRSFELDSKLKQFSDSINQKLEGYLTDNCTIYQPPQQYSNSRNYNCSQNQAHLLILANQQWQPETHKLRSPISNFEISTKSGTISKHLPVNDAAANLPSTSISDSSLSTIATSNISTTATHNISTAATSNLSTPINSDTTPKFTMVVHQLIPSSSNSPSGLHLWNSGTSATQNPNSQNYLSLLITPEDTTTNNLESNQQQTLTNNIPPATVTNDKLLAAIFLFDLKEMIKILLFSGAALEKKPITTMYTDAKIDGHAIKLILDSGLAGSIITRQLMDQLADRAIKTPIGKIDNLPIEINSIMVPIKVLVMEATQYQALVSWADIDHNELLPILLSPTLSWEEKRKGKKKENNLPEKTELTKDTTSGWTSLYFIHEPLPQPPHILLKYKNCEKKLSSMEAWVTPDKNYWMQTHYYYKSCHCKWYDYPKRQDKWDNKPCFACGEQLFDKRMWNNIPAISHLDGYPHDKDEIWQMANAKIEDTMSSKILEIKNNSPKPVNIILVPNSDAFFDIETNPEDFYKHYQNLVPTREEQKEWLAQLNTRLCDYCLISCDFQYCNECDLIYNPPIHIIYTIPEEEKPISSCTLKSEPLFDPDLNSDNDNNENTSSSFVQNSDNNDNDSNSDSNSNLKYEQYITILNLTRELKLK